MHHAIMGAVFIATVLWAPDGLVGLAGRIRARLFRKNHG
jgi:ABC-type branched-subunit amino acid transport system permease subunit